MKLLHVIRSTDPAGGGPIEVVRQFSRAHLEQGHQVEVASLDRPEQIFAGDSELPTHRLGTQKGSYGRSPQFVPWLRERARDFDAVLVHGLWQFHGQGTRLALREADTPYFLYPHGMLDPWFSRAYPLKHLKKAIYWRLVEHRVLRDAAAVLYTCEEERRLAQNTFRPYRCTERIAPLGIAAPSGDADQQRGLFLERFPQLRGKRILLFLGRLHDKKGCDLLIRAFARILCTFKPSTSNPQPLHLVLAGPCESDAYLQQMKTLAASELSSLGHSPSEASISFPGMLSGNLKWGAYRAAEAFVLPSHQENFGIAVAEALACGVPVLIANKVNIWREIERDGAGLIAEDTLEGSYRLMQSWEALGEQERLAMRLRALKCFQDRFSIQHAAASVLSTLELALDSNSAVRGL